MFPTTSLLRNGETVLQLSGVASPSALKYIDLRQGRFANPSTTFSQLQSLRVLKFRSCVGIDNLPESIGKLTALEKLDLRYCDYLVGLPESFGNLCSLTYLRLEGCKQLSLPESFGNLASLELLRLDWCSGLLNVPQNFGQLKRLKYLSITGCSGLESLSADFEGLSSLIAIHASFCPKLEGETIEKVAKMKGVMVVNISESPLLEERWEEVEDQYSLAVKVKVKGIHFLYHMMDRSGPLFQYDEYMRRALLQNGSRLVHADENGEYHESPPPQDGLELCLLLTVCDLTLAGNRRHLEEVKKKWEEVGGEKMKVFVEVGVNSWEESERRVREMLPHLPRGSRGWIAADSRARLLFADSLFMQANHCMNNRAIKYEATVIAGISEWGGRSMIVNHIVIPDCTPDFEDAHIFHQLFSPLSKAGAFFMN